MERIGLIAGNRKLPIIFSQAAKKRNYYIVAVAIKGDTSRKLKKFVDKIYWIGLSEFRRCLEIFKAEGITKVVMAGQITPWRLFNKEIDRDQELRSLLANIRDKKADTIFGMIAEKLKESGLELLNSTTFIEELLVKKGTLTEKEPGAEEWEDIYFGLDLAKAVANLDIGQTVAVKKKAIVAVEALEGTDNLIRRAGRIAREGITIVKVSKPKQDLRFDIPVVGLNTVKNLIRVGARCLAIEAEKTLFIDKEQSIKLADQRGISIVAI
ncbi:MAG: UDP-2,3-diacylglucosamine diphosphatase LpxI [Candidatus Omnitrophica bacterium]|nr:UDP-2,3-diacylglucosamine diphosphatase LpxI [Candidatus Omnitrophota bacterium]MBU4473136.1 UDP-2,3-diacylglucosamine diphosphatase LpxI [Candidatus Omnitrophota bacterium]MCG2706423.1 UDP-2,3-diacylglucosamine diphosphatase LpxI [Candidatus Omnitrophota bacterium]